MTINVQPVGKRTIVHLLLCATTLTPALSAAEKRHVVEGLRAAAGKREPVGQDNSALLRRSAPGGFLDTRMRAQLVRKATAQFLLPLWKEATAKRSGGRGTSLHQQVHSWVDAALLIFRRAGAKAYSGVLHCRDADGLVPWELEAGFAPAAAAAVS